MCTPKPPKQEKTTAAVDQKKPLRILLSHKQAEDLDLTTSTPTGSPTGTPLTGFAGALASAMSQSAPNSNIGQAYALRLASSGLSI